MTLKAAQNCYIAPVDDYETFCLPDEQPDISNATFYRCGGNGDPTPVITDVKVKCESITIFTENIDPGETLFVRVTYVGEIVDEFEPTVDEDGVAQVTLDGDLDPSYLVVEYDGTTLFDQNIVAADGPCSLPKCKRKKRKKHKHDHDHDHDHDGKRKKRKKHKHDHDG